MLAVISPEKAIERHSLSLFVVSAENMSSLSVRVNRRSRLRRPKPYRYCSNSVALATGGTRGVVFFAAMVFACIGSTPHGTSAFLALPRSSVGTRNGGDGACSCWGDRRNVAARTQPRRCDCSTSTAGSSVVRLSSKAEHIRERLVPAHDIASGSSVEETRMPELNHDEIRRYSRHLILPDVGVTGQRRLKASSVLAVGTGGLGSPALLYLAAAGVGRLGIVDNDVVDESNLQRQVIHGTATLGKPKVESARDRMLDVNPHVTVETFHEQLTSENALRILDGYDVVLDGSDNFPTKYLVNDACEILGIPNVYGAILGFEGQMSVFSYKGGPTYRDLLPSPPPPGLVPSCAEGGVLGILPGVVGCIQATEVIKILLGKGDVLSGRLLVYDALQMSFKESNLDKTPGRPAVTSLIDYQGFCGFSASASNTPPVASGTPGGANGEEEGEKAREGFQRISPQDVVAKMQAGWAPYVLDVRLPQEAEIASLPFVDRVCPHRKVSGIVRQLPRGTDLLVHCKVGGRSAKACATLSEHGIPEARLYNMEGGIIRWAKEVDSSLAVY